MAKARRKKKARKAPKVRHGRNNGQLGRPVELTDELLARVAKSVEDGNYIETAAELEGVSPHSVRQLLRHGAKELRRMELDNAAAPEPSLARAVTFALLMRKARAKAERDDLEAIRTAGKKHWQAHAWRLERRQPDRWGRRPQHIDASATVRTPGGGDGGEMTITLTLKDDVVETEPEV